MKNLKRLRELAGMTQAELAHETGIDRTRLSLAESGFTRLTATETEEVKDVAARAMRKRHAEISRALAELAAA
jgi:transcriptional regulator with XRE-family HTH domain